jgi:hypothetical protein
MSLIRGNAQVIDKRKSMKQGQVKKITATTTEPGEKDFQGSGVEGKKVLVTMAGGKARRQIWEDGRLIGEE